MGCFKGSNRGTESEGRRNFFLEEKKARGGNISDMEI
jgi:hypothetical protein